MSKTFVQSLFLSMAFVLGAEAATQSGTYLALNQAYYNRDDLAILRYWETSLENRPDDLLAMQSALVASVIAIRPDLTDKYYNQGKTKESDTGEFSTFPTVKAYEFALALRDGHWDLLEDLNRELEIYNPALLEAWVAGAKGEFDRIPQIVKKFGSPDNEADQALSRYEEAMIYASFSQDYKKAAEIIYNEGNPRHINERAFGNFIVLNILAGNPKWAQLVMDHYGAVTTAPSYIQDWIRGAHAGEIDPTLDFKAPQNALASVLWLIHSPYSNMPNPMEDERLFLLALTEFFAPDKESQILSMMSVYAYAGESDDVLFLSEHISDESALVMARDISNLDAYLSMGRHAEARVLLDSMPSEAPDVLFAKASGSLRLQDFDVAKETLQKLLAQIDEKHKSYVQANIFLAMARDYTGDWSGAKENFEAALKVDPKNSSLLNHYGYSLVFRKDDIARGLDLIEQSLMIDPDNSAARDSLGWAYYQMGEYEKALPPVLSSVTSYVSEPVTNAHLGDIFWKTGRKREAVWQWERALEFLSEDLADLKRADLEDRLENGLH